MMRSNSSRELESDGHEAKDENTCDNAQKEICEARRRSYVSRRETVSHPKAAQVHT